MATINPYLNFKGNTEEAFNFYKSVFGGEFAVVMRYKDSPEAAHQSAEDQEKLMHIALPIGSGNVLMGTDVVGQMADDFKGGNNFYLSYHADSDEQADQIFAGLSAGGHAFMPMQKTFWGSYFGMLVDPFGVSWMVNHDQPQG